MAPISTAALMYSVGAGQKKAQNGLPPTLHRGSPLRLFRLIRLIEGRAGKGNPNPLLRGKGGAVEKINHPFSRRERTFHPRHQITQDLVIYP